MGATGTLSGFPNRIAVSILSCAALATSPPGSLLTCLLQLFYFI